MAESGARKRGSEGFVVEAGPSHAVAASGGVAPEEELAQLRGYVDGLQSKLLSAGLDFDQFEASDRQVNLDQARAARRERRQQRRAIKLLGAGARQGVVVRFHDLKSTTTLSHKPDDNTCWGAFLSSRAGYLFRPRQVFPVLDGVSGVIPAGSMTLVLGSPGSGKRSLLRILAGTLRHQRNTTTTGSVTYNGHRLPVDNATHCSFVPERVSAFVPNTDYHNPSLSIEQSLDFACDMLGGEIEEGARAHFRDALDLSGSKAAKVAAMLDVLDIDGAVASAKLGSGTKRGIDHAVLRALSLGEMLMGLHGAYFVDQLGTALDDRTVFRVVSAMKKLSERFGCSFVISMNSCPPEVFQMFDRLVFLAAGHAIYNGPVSACIPHFTAQPLCKAQADKLAAGEIDATTFLRAVMLHATTHANLLTLKDAFEASEQGKALQTQLAEPEETVEWDPQYVQPYARSFAYIATRCASLHRIVLLRDKIVVSRVVQSIVAGLLLGSLFFDLDDADFVSRFGLMFTIVIFSVLSGKAQLSVTMASRKVFAKQHRAHFYPTIACVLGHHLALVPLAVAEAALLVVPIYNMADLAGSGSRFGVALALVFLANLANAQTWRLIGNVAPSLSTATPLSACVVLCMVLFSGYPLGESSYPVGWEWVAVINPLRFAFRGLCINEFKDAKFDAQDPECVLSDVVPSCRQGDVYLNAYGLSTDTNSLTLDIVSLVVYNVLMLLANVIALSIVPKSMGQLNTNAGRRTTHSEFAALIRTHSVQKRSAVVLPVCPVTMAWDDIGFSIHPESHPHGLHIIQHAEGYIRPGTMTAVMGPSGSGKTTLLRLLSGQVDSGRMHGEIVINHRRVPMQHSLPDFSGFNALTGFVAHDDVVTPLATVEESLFFNVRLRSPASLSERRVRALVRNTLRVMGLRFVKDKLVGNKHVTAEERRMTTISCELMANPSVLFLDEPLKGLSTVAASRVVETLRTLTDEERSIVCAFSQTSSSTFSLFDMALVLGKDGGITYFGPTTAVVAHFESIPEVPCMHRNSNPAAYVMEMVSEAHPSLKDRCVNFRRFYQHSPIRKELDRALTNFMRTELAGGKESEVEMQPVVKGGAQPAALEAGQPGGEQEAGEAQKLPTQRRKASLFLQYQQCILRAVLAYFRAPAYSLARICAFVAIAVLIVTAYAGNELNTQPDVIGRLGSILVSCSFLGSINMITVVPMVMQDKLVFTREHGLGMYSTLPYIVATTLAELPFLLLTSFAFVNVFYWMAGMENDFERFVWYFVFFALYMTFCTYLGHFLAILCPSTYTATVSASVFVGYFSVFSGIIIPEAEIPDYWRILYRTNPLMYAVEGMVATQFHNNDVLVVQSNGQATTAEAYASAHLAGAFDYGDRWRDVAALLSFIVVVRALAFATLRFKGVENRDA